MYYSRENNDVCRAKGTPELWLVITAVTVLSLFFILYVFVFSSERTKSAKGDHAVYRLKDWPSGEEFLALMPSRLVLHTSTFSQLALYIHTAYII